MAASSRLVVFDLDGTLVDSCCDLAESANELITRYGGQPLPVDAVARMVGEGARVLVERALAAASIAAAGPEALDHFLAIYERRLTAHTRCYAGVEAALDWLDGRAFQAVLTNKPTRHTTLLLEYLGLARHFHWVIGGDGPFPRKPDPAGLCDLMTRAAVSAERTLLVGDSMVDVETGRRAGCRVCVASYGFAQFQDGLRLDASEAVAAVPEDLLSHLRAFVGEDRNA